MSVFVCVKRRAVGGGRGLFGTPVLFGSYPDERWPRRSSLAVRPSLFALYKVERPSRHRTVGESSSKLPPRRRGNRQAEPTRAHNSTNNNSPQEGEEVGGYISISPFKAPV